jgi:ADP-heptose:LPS heptosyltransferase
MTPVNSQWLIVSFSEPVMFNQTADETWLFSPNRRYIVNANRLEPIKQFVESVSELSEGSLYVRLGAGRAIKGAKILVERNRERGIGDLLFLTGPLAYMQHVSGGDVEIDLMAFADRGIVLTHSPLIHNGCVRCGPLEYDHLRLYNYHWLINSVTEQDQEGDQPNIYDALFAQLGFDPTAIEAQWKRPSVTMVSEDYQNLDRLYKFIWDQRKVDLRKIGYIVVAPFSNATPRSLNYQRWLVIIQALAARRPVVVVGNSSLRLPDTDMSAGQFSQHVASMGGGVVNAIDCTSIRVLMALISRSFCTIGLDSAPIYMAQALKVPAISIWGTHPPGCRIGYDKNMMDLAIWNQEACQYSPCFAFGGFPANKCPMGANQGCCEVLASIVPDDVLKKVDMIETASAPVVIPAPSKA